MKTQIIVLFLTLLVVSHSFNFERGDNPLDTNPSSIDIGNIKGKVAEKAKVAKEYAKMIGKYGVKAWKFLDCMGYDWALKCVPQTQGCLATRDMKGCVELISCEGMSAKTCAKNLN